MPTLYVATSNPGKLLDFAAATAAALRQKFDGRSLREFLPKGSTCTGDMIVLR